MLSEQSQPSVTFNKMLLFFLPLGLSAMMVSLSHVVINSTLARTLSQPEITIAGYAIASSIFNITERPATLLRQTCSALVRDRLAFRAMIRVTIMLILGILGVSSLIAFTPVGTWLFTYVFGAEATLRASISETYRILMLVTVFSGIRCLFHGVLISHFRTKWLTIGMVVRLVCMYVLSLWFLRAPEHITGQTGAVIFLVGMMVEAAVSYFEGRLVVRKMPQVSEHAHERVYHRSSEILAFYRPLLYSSVLAVAIGPAINVALGKTEQIEVAIAAYAIAASVCSLIISSISYMHQIVLNFYRLDAAKVFRFSFAFSLVPAVCLGVLAFTPIGTFLLSQWMGIGDNLLPHCIAAMRVFMIMVLIYPWVDYCNGLIMLNGHTKAMVWSQSANVGLTLLVMVFLVWLLPGLNSMVGALAQSLGLAAELSVIAIFVWILKRNQKRNVSSRMLR